MVHHVADSKQWRFINEKWQDFASEPQSICLGLTTDGINPFIKKIPFKALGL
jgi:hypothetical protein